MKRFAFYGLFCSLMFAANAKVPGKRTDKSKSGSIGFRSFLAYDSSRPAIKEQSGNYRDKGRVVQVNMWYPAQPTNAKSLSAYDYLILKALETDREVPDKNRELIAKSLLATNYSTTLDSIHQLFKSGYSFRAVRDAGFTKERYPLVVLFHNDALGFAPMAEALAASGFVVVNFPITGTTSKKFDWETVAGIQTEINDLDFVVKSVSNLPMVDSGCIIPVGYSYGGMAALAYQLRNKNLKGVISLDGGIGSLWGGDMVFKLPGFQIDQLRKPVFHAWSDLNNPYADHTWLRNYICCERYLLKFKSLRHGDFVEGRLFEKLMPGFTTSMLGSSPKNSQEEFEKLLQSLTNFSLWIATGNMTYKAKLGKLQLPYEEMNALSCAHS